MRKRLSAVTPAKGIPSNSYMLGKQLLFAAVKSRSLIYRNREKFLFIASVGGSITRAEFFWPGGITLADRHHASLRLHAPQLV